MSKAKRSQPANVAEYIDVADAPIIFFDLCVAQGVLAGAIEIELAARTLSPIPKSRDVTVKFVTSGRLRCSAVAAVKLRNALDTALKLLSGQTGDSTPTKGESAKLN